MGKAKTGARTCAFCKLTNAVMQAGRQTKGTSLPVKTGDKTPVIPHESQELPDTPQTVWNGPGLDIFDLLGVTLQSSTTNDMAQEGHRSPEQMTFRRFQL